MTAFRIVLALLTPALLLAGCGSDGDTSAEGQSANDCGSAFNPATTVVRGFSNFRISEPQALDHVLFRDLIEGAQPGDPDDSRGNTIADAIETETARFTGVAMTSDGTGILSVRNPLDLLHNVIGEGSVENFNAGRRYISDCIDAGNAAQYATSANGALITFEEVQNDQKVDEYVYANLRWVYTPDTTGNVIRGIRYVGQPGDFLDGAVLASVFGGKDFSATGYNQPEALEASFTGGDDAERLGIQQAFSGMDKDQWIRSSDGTFVFAGETVDCARVLIDYRAQTAELLTSLGEESGSAAYCGNLEEGTGETYSTQPVPERQQ